MAPVDGSIALSHVNGISDAARARELYKYYKPTGRINTESCFPGPPTPVRPHSKDPGVQSDITSTKISSPDTSLTAFCQLVSWRLGAQRAMISLIDDDTQYFIAESTKSLDLVDSTKHKPGDELWLGCTSVSKAGKLCERTIQTAPLVLGEEYPSFIVNDLTLDDRFNQLSFVAEPPYIRFYAGVPLITKRGIPIGSLFVVDENVRSGLSKDDIFFMGTMAATVMKHLELTREVEEHRRGMKISRGLASFVEGRAELEEADMEAEDGEGTKIVGQFETDTGIRRKSRSSSNKGSRMSSVTSLALGDSKEKGYMSLTSLAATKLEEISMTSPNKSDSPGSGRPGVESTAHHSSFGGTTTTTEQSLFDICKTDTPDEEFTEASALKLLFSRAANLIREAFEVDGGAVFYDAQKGFNSDAQATNQDSSVTDSQASGDDDFQTGFSPRSSISRLPRGGERSFTRSSTMSATREIEILGFSTPEASSINGDAYPGTHSFLPFEEKSLHSFLRRYPRGKLWTFDSDGSISSASDDEILKGYRCSRRENRNQMRGKNKVAKAEADGRFLSNHFPGVRQLLFVPLWDAGRSRWLSACCVWSTEPTRILSKQNELSFLSAFGNSVMAECSRISTEVADQKKSDFIGSISHELRSPLHGILASAEILDDLNLSNLAQELVETIDSCGRTLLDTINHILDFSKISSLEKNWRRNRQGNTKRISQSSSAGPLALQQADLPMINLFAPVDVAVLCEEVVESVFAGYVFQNVTAKTFDMVHDAHDKNSDSKRHSASSLAMPSPGNQSPQVSVILDIALDDYNFTTQPGAFRRIIMNLLGNSLKYTSHGYVRVKLETAKLEDLNVSGGEKTPRSMVILTVTDTGKGISSEFLRSKLFTPFAQENTLSSGTGLGLSIVRSIINLLEGDITIDSELGRGTEVRVTLPLLREIPKDTSILVTPKAATSLLRETDESIELLRNQIGGRDVGLFNFNPPTMDPVLAKKGKFLEASVINYLTNWYGLKIVPLSNNPDIILANAPDLSVLLNLSMKLPRYNKPSILVLSPHSSRFNHSFAEAGIKSNVTVVAKPVGPLKLARALRSCLDGSTSTSGMAITPDPSGIGQASTNDLSNVFEDLCISSHGGEVLDNRRMATDSENARKAIESPTPNALVEKAKEFPFPLLPGGKTSPRGQLSYEDNLPTPTLLAFGSTSQPNSLTGNLASQSPESSTASASTRQSSLPVASPDLFAPNLLLVDDNMINLKLLRHFVTRLGYTTVHEAENGLEAVKKVEERPEGYDVIFMDISMPVLDGFDATREIRKLEKSRQERAIANGEPLGGRTKHEALVVALTGLAGKEDVEKARACGIDLFMTKPVALKEVRKMLENWRANQKGLR